MSLRFYRIAVRRLIDGAKYVAVVNPSPKWPKSNEHPERSRSGIRIPPRAYRVTVLNILGGEEGSVLLRQTELPAVVLEPLRVLVVQLEILDAVIGEVGVLISVPGADRAPFEERELGRSLTGRQLTAFTREAVAAAATRRAKDSREQK
jgi:hypothetical protein